MTMLKNQVLNVDGKNWLVREAVTEGVARSTIAHARVTGSIGGKDSTTDTNGVTTVLADVVRLNDDNTECLPYGEKGGTDHSALVDLANARVQADRLGRAHEQSLFRNREYAAALACVESLATGELPCYHDAEFLRSEIMRVIGECRDNIAKAKAEAQAGSAA
jgi:hypothetical protein